VAGKGDEVVTR